jgi:UDP-glucose 4-epimerase
LPRFIEAARTGRPLRVYGDGRQTRCFCYVSDTVEALVRLQRRPPEQGEVFNVGNDEEITIRQLARLVIETLNSSSPIEFVPYEKAYAPGFEDMRRRVPDTSRIRGLTGWEPTRTIDDIVCDVIEHERTVIESEVPAQ